MFIIDIMGWNYRHKKLNIYRQSGVLNYLFLLLRSPTLLTLNNTCQDVMEPACILYNVRSPQIYKSLDIDDNELWANDFIHFYGDDVQAFAQKIDLPFDTLILLNDESEVSNRIKEIAEEHKYPGLYSDINIDLKIKSLLLDVALISKKNELDMLQMNTSVAENLKQLRLYILDNLAEKWSVAKMAEHVHLSPSYLHKIYFKLFNVSPNKDLTDKRISKSKYYLGCTDLSVKEIAEKIGFQNEYHFIRLFKKHVGITPDKYSRIRQKEEVSNIWYDPEQTI